MESILYATEIEFFVNTIRPNEMENLGSMQWLECHQRFLKLNQQASIEVTTLKEEFVKNSFILFGKVNVLIHEAILVNIWKYKVLPHLLKLEPVCESTIIAYAILFHEGISVSLLEIICYHPDSFEMMGESVFDLLDYSVGIASQLLYINYKETISKENTEEELERQRDNIIFDIGLKALTIIRYICENMDKLPLGICSNIYSQYDIPMIFIEILRKKPWILNNKEYFRGKWRDFDGDRVCAPEIQIWLTLRHLLLDQACFQYYSITESRKTQLLNLLKLITPNTIDQLSPLIELKQWLFNISVMELPNAGLRPILIENSLEIKENILNQTGENWKEIAKKQIDFIFSNDKNYFFECAKILNEVYNTDLLEKFDEKTRIPCERCGSDSTQRCSKCKKAWYCTRKCQVSHWIQHKENCTEAKN